MLPAEDSLPVALVEGWPVPNPESAVVLRESGITLGEIMLNDEEWPTLRSSPVYSVRIDDHAANDGWTTTEPDGTKTHHEVAIPTSPVLVPPEVLDGARSLSDWVWSTHGAVGRLLLWSDRPTWWIVQEPDLELTFLCSPAGMFNDASDVLSWWGIGTDGARTEVNELCARYGVKRP